MIGGWLFCGIYLSYQVGVVAGEGGGHIVPDGTGYKTPPESVLERVRQGIPANRQAGTTQLKWPERRVTRRWCVPVEVFCGRVGCAALHHNPRDGGGGVITDTTHRSLLPLSDCSRSNDPRGTTPGVVV
jgi:hypothetical protein